MVGNVYAHTDDVIQSIYDRFACSGYKPAVLGASMVKHSGFKGYWGRSVVVDEALNERYPLFPVIRVKEFKHLGSGNVRVWIADNHFTQIIVTANKLSVVIDNKINARKTVDDCLVEGFLSFEFLLDCLGFGDILNHNKQSPSAFIYWVERTSENLAVPLIFKEERFA